VARIAGDRRLWDRWFRDSRFGEWKAAKVFGVDGRWPGGQKWDACLDRVSASWERRLKIIRDDKSLTPPKGRAKQLEVEAEKQDKRSLEIEDINAKPLHVRWTVNHLARRTWRNT